MPLGLIPTSSPSNSGKKKQQRKSTERNAPIQQDQSLRTEENIFHTTDDHVIFFKWFIKQKSTTKIQSTSC